jgi:hypothetical protein
LVLTLAQLPDFYMEMSWALRSIVPFLARMAPSDHYKVSTFMTLTDIPFRNADAEHFQMWKKGSSLRVDLTMAGMSEKYRTERGHMSYIFMGIDTDTPGDVVMIDHVRKEYCSAMDWFKQPNAEEMSLMAERMMKTVIGFLLVCLLEIDLTCAVCRRLLVATWTPEPRS